MRNRPNQHPVTLTAIAVAAVFVLSAAPARAQVASAEDSARALHLLSRATFGARPSDIGAVLTAGRDRWLERQLHPESIRDTLGPLLDQRYPAGAMSMDRLYEEFAPPPRPKAAAGDSMMAVMDSAAVAAARKSRKAPGKSPQALLMDLAAAKVERSTYTDRQLEEVMTDFWFNHFNVFFQKGADRYLVADYERNAIRPHVFGKFEDLLLATAQHPAMLFYLDNWQSVHVDSSAMSRVTRRMPPAQQAAAKQRARGLNENYARELMELHTLGVDGGYTQQDVVNVARALTGWTFVPPRGAGAGAGAVALRGAGRGAGAGRAGAGRAGDDVGFTFRPQLHDRGEKIVLGHRLPAGRGIEDGRDVIHILATQPATAHFVATKLVEYFVNDAPPQQLVDHVAATFTKTNGDLREVTRTLFSDPLFYAMSNRRAKVKTPFQLVVSAFRATDAQLANPRGVMQTLRAMGDMPYMASPPTGYPAQNADWVNSGALLARMNFGIDYASGKMAGSRLNARSVFNGAAQAGDGTAALHAAAARLLPGVDASALEKTIMSDLAAQPDSVSNPRARAARAAGLLIGSPEFQRH